jgi:hypothetical protein
MIGPRLEFLSTVPSTLPYAVEAPASTLISDDHRVTLLAASIWSWITGRLAGDQTEINDLAEAVIQRRVFRCQRVDI